VQGGGGGCGCVRVCMCVCACVCVLGVLAESWELPRGVARKEAGGGAPGACSEAWHWRPWACRLNKGGLHHGFPFLRLHTRGTRSGQGSSQTQGGSCVSPVARAGALTAAAHLVALPPGCPRCLLQAAAAGPQLTHLLQQRHLEWKQQQQQLMRRVLVQRVMAGACRGSCFGMLLLQGSRP